MPLYEYRCNECGDEFEKRVSFSETDHLPVCQKCESQNTQKKLSRVVSFGAASSGAVSASSSSCGSHGGFS